MELTKKRAIEPAKNKKLTKKAKQTELAKKAGVYEKNTTYELEKSFRKRTISMLTDCFDFFQVDELKDERAKKYIQDMADEFILHSELLYKRYDLDLYRCNLSDNDLPELMMRRKYKMIWLAQQKLNSWTWGYADCRCFFENLEND